MDMAEDNENHAMEICWILKAMIDDHCHGKYVWPGLRSGATQVEREAAKKLDAFQDRVTRLRKQAEGARHENSPI